MRCLALAQAWSDAGGSAAFILGEESRPFSGPLDREGIEVHTAKSLLGSTEDGLATAELAGSLEAPWIVADGYAFGEEFQNAARGPGGRLLVIDDDARIGRYTCDLIVDHNPDADRSKYGKGSASTRLLLGSQFALLRREFRLSQDPGQKPHRQPLRLLITLGGSDPTRMTERMLDLVDRAGTHLEVSLVVGRGGERPTSPTDARILFDVEDMASIMADADLAIAAGGTTAWELAAMGVPSLLGRVVDNQDAVVRALARHGAAIDVGWFGRELEGALDALASNPRRMEEMGDAGRRLMNRGGASAVVEEMLRG